MSIAFLCFLQLSVDGKWNREIFTISIGTIGQEPQKMPKLEKHNTPVFITLLNK